VSGIPLVDDPVPVELARRDEQARGSTDDHGEHAGGRQRHIHVGLTDWGHRQVEAGGNGRRGALGLLEEGGGAGDDQRAESGAPDQDAGAEVGAIRQRHRPRVEEAVFLRDLREVAGARHVDQ
jgi:hypothetical protein